MNADPPSVASAAPHARRAILTGALLIAGALIWAGIGGGRGIGAVRWGVIAAVAILAMLPPVSASIVRMLDRIRHPSPARRRAVAIGIALMAAAYFILTAFLQDRDLFAKTHDDCSYLIQMQMLARGRLWMPPLPLPDFFDSFYLIVRPVYGSQYFPGTALMYVPTIWLHLPIWVLPVLAAGAVVGLVYRVLVEIVDGMAGALGALWVVSLSWYRMVSVLIMSQVPALLLGLIMVWGWLRWRRSRRAGWILLIGIAAGWAAITRPVDAICYAVPLGLAIACELMGSPIRKWLVSAVLVCVGAAPFLGIQLAFDKGVTGHYFETPFRMYLDQNAPGTEFGFPKYDPAMRPQSVLLAKQAYYQGWVAPFIQQHQPDQVWRAWATKYLPQIADTTMPARVMIPLALVGLAGLTTRRRLVLWATVPLFVGLYFFYTIFLEHYAIAIIPAVAMSCVLGVDGLADALPRFRTTLLAGGTMLIGAACLTSLWEINHWIAPEGRQVDDETFRSFVLRTVEQDVPNAAGFQKPAVILFKYHPGDNYFEEPVYNTGAAWPDDAEIIRAHDLGAGRDREIVDYYAARKPVRWFYLFDAKSQNAIEPLGSTADPAEIVRRLDQIEGGKK